MKEWHQRIADAAIVAADAVDPLRRKWDVDYEDGQPVVARRQIGPIIAERDALYRVLAALIAGWDALPYNWSVVVRCEDDARRLLAETGPT